MSAVVKGEQPDAAAYFASSDINAEIERIRGLKPEEVRELWRTTFRRQVPRALTKDLLVRAICWHIQEKALGGHSPEILKLLDSYAPGRPAEVDRLRRLKPGTEMVREYQGKRHTVVITAAGYQWQGETYRSLSSIARAITGANWNGPRFFGLREQGNEGKSAKPGRGEAKPGSGGGPPVPEAGSGGRTGKPRAAPVPAPGQAAITMPARKPRQNKAADHG